MTQPLREARSSDAAPETVPAREALRAAPAPEDRTRELLWRVFSGLFLIVTALGSLRLGGDWFGLFWLIAAFGIVYEWQTLVADRHPLKRFAVGAVSLALVTRLTLESQPQSALLLLAAAATVTALLAEPGRRLWAAAGILYAGAMLLAVVLLRTAATFGTEAVLWLFAIVWSNDIMAFVGGRVLGGPKLWQSVSPSKTWAGFAVGNAAGATAGLLVVPVHGHLAAYLLLGLVCGIAAQAGDLAESAIKRHFGVKDAGSIIPGHGGVMDRLDGFVAAAVLAAAVGILSGGLGDAGAGLFSW